MAEPPVDREALLNTVDHDLDFLTVLVDTFLDDCADYVAALRDAVERSDAEALANEAHGLKGAAAHLHAEPTRRAARRLEEMGRKGTLDDAPDALDTLEAAIDRLRPALRALADERGR